MLCRCETRPHTVSPSGGKTPPLHLQRHHQDAMTVSSIFISSFYSLPINVPVLMSSTAECREEPGLSAVITPHHRRRVNAASSTPSLICRAAKVRSWTECLLWVFCRGLQLTGGCGLLLHVRPEERLTRVDSPGQSSAPAAKTKSGKAKQEQLSAYTQTLNVNTHTRNSYKEPFK